MKMLTKALLEEFAKTGSQEKNDDPDVIAVFFYANFYWFATEYEPEAREFFGYVSMFNDWNDEFGYFSLDELEQPLPPFGLSVERDLYWKRKPLSLALKEKGRNVPSFLVKEE